MTERRAQHPTAAARALVVRTTGEQGLPERLSDPSVLAAVAGLMERSHEDDVSEINTRKTSTRKMVAGVDRKRVTA